MGEEVGYPLGESYEGISVSNTAVQGVEVAAACSSASILLW